MKHRLSTIILAAAASVFALSACDTSVATAATPAPAPFSTTVQAAYDSIAGQTTGFTLGAPLAAKVAYVFFDPQCPHCAHLWNAAQPLGASARIVWIPIGMLSRASAPQGATILGAADPAKAMTENETSILNRQGGLTADSDAVARFKDKVAANTALFNSMRAKDDGVPFIVTKVNGEVRSQSGSLSTPQLKQFLGLPN
ncbi:MULTISPECIES: thioredoxin domain-containing protein [unclassified Variovorax]|uniref:thioredoxin domain-containing protein n=1 Tax=unclassified Variovorax TaxID=663243 RepID=UPI001316B8D8|nr:MULTISPECIES: thioredoxin domain-containing protein [unclassified Variovorax]VTU42752.1 Thiol:disulfide interchange protein DsbG precursor [Variovorax sp. PBL-H6]VTU43706.1 Thiol:disulfide interchange protein DsbG precursor [Variovorax sp. SRS16]VTU43771.1 Thiol:disulfide interchange protein DsbG precursor [Variovorax sp. PBL-E5]